MVLIILINSFDKAQVLFQSIHIDQHNYFKLYNRKTEISHNNYTLWLGVLLQHVTYK